MHIKVTYFGFIFIRGLGDLEASLSWDFFFLFLLLCLCFFFFFLFLHSKMAINYLIWLIKYMCSNLRKVRTDANFYSYMYRLKKAGLDLWWGADSGTSPKCARNTKSGVRSSSVDTRGAGGQLFLLIKIHT